MKLTNRLLLALVILTSLFSTAKSQEKPAIPINTAVENVQKKIAKKLIGKNVYNQKQIDDIMVELDNTPNKSNLGANSILGVSLATAKAAANSLNMEFYEYLGGTHDEYFKWRKAFRK